MVRERFFDREEARPENIKYKFYFAPQIAKHLHQPKMFNERRFFAHSLVIKSKLSLGVEPTAVSELGDLLAK